MKKLMLAFIFMIALTTACSELFMSDPVQPTDIYQVNNEVVIAVPIDIITDPSKVYPFVLP